MNSKNPNPLSPLINIEAIALQSDREDGGFLNNKTNVVNKPLSQILNKPNTWPLAKPGPSNKNRNNSLSQTRLVFEDSSVQFQPGHRSTGKQLKDPLVGHPGLIPKGHKIQYCNSNLSDDDSDFESDQNRMSRPTPTNQQKRRFSPQPQIWSNTLIRNGIPGGDTREGESAQAWWQPTRARVVHQLEPLI